MKIKLYYISKTMRLESIEEHYIQQCKQFGAEIVCENVFNNNITKAQKASKIKAQQSYCNAFLSLLSQGINIALHPNGKSVDTDDFCDLIKKSPQFFIGGAFGFEDSFLKKTIPISLSPLTLGHNIARIILVEQIYRALSILHHHPYHK